MIRRAQNQNSSRSPRRRSGWRLLLAFLLLPAGLNAENNSFDDAARSARSDLEAALSELRETRETIAREKIPLVRRLREIETEVGQLRRELENQRGLRDMNQAEVQTLRTGLTRREDQFRYQQGLLAEYLRDLESNLPISELETFAPALRQARDHAAFRELVETGRGTLAFDPTLGQAIRRAEARTTLGERIRAGGVVMFPILGLALIALIIALIKWIQIAGINVAPPAVLQEILDLLEKGKPEEAAKRASAVRGPVGELLQAGVENAREQREILEEILYEKILRTRPGLERYLPFLALTAAAAPLLGLLGTVTGMINTFQLITLFGTGDARTLSGGISEALITTQFGLGIAIVALLVHSLLSRKAKGVIANMEQTEAALLNGLSGTEPSNHG